ncbi:hypothetical protein BASA83_009704 [Batrachochytrium salamandrivorans]|nr:hypothetical protein BASA83_009704 [Batrachochytrium salamandrivorans]
MSQVLQTIQLIHSAFVLMFYLTHRSELQKNWDEIQRTTTRLDDPNILKMANQKHILSRINIKGQSLETVAWVSLDLASSLETSQHGGKFSIAPNFNINAPSVFLRRFFPYGVIIVQCGFFMYCATINVLPFRYQPVLSKIPAMSSLSLKSMYQDENADAYCLVFSRNRVINGRYRLSKDESSSSSSLFKYTPKTPQTYGFQSLMFDGTTTACWLTIPDIPFVFN